MGFERPLAVITGASGGIGAAIAQRLARSGYDMVLVGRKAEALDALKHQLEYVYPAAQITTIAADITDSESRSALLAKLEGLPQKVALLVNNAGINCLGLLTSQSEDMIQAQFATNAIAPILLSRLMLQAAGDTSRLQIINVGSTFGSIGYPGFSVYSASKFALRGFTQALAREYADTGVRVRYFAPRATRTALNSSAVEAMNAELGVAMDDPDTVADEFERFLHSNKAAWFVGWPEKVFVAINQLRPSIVAGALRKQLPVIRKYAG